MRGFPVRNQYQLFTAFFSKEAFAQGSKRSSQKLFRVGACFFSRIPTRPLARAVRCADSILRAFLSFPCFVDSRIISPFHMNLYQ